MTLPISPPQDERPQNDRSHSNRIRRIVATRKDQRTGRLAIRSRNIARTPRPPAPHTLLPCEVNNLGAELVFINLLRNRIQQDHPILRDAGPARVEAVALFALARYLHHRGLLAPYLAGMLEQSLSEVYRVLLGAETGLLPPTPRIPINKRTMGGV